ncbi:hypothetical protein HRG_009055 [Hirsutella rhossiliensis]|uniref:Uncharacterized protein n=1 Tax=Hirsutella rhossiliensis TaxID=111463 RepID=A0A9P8SFH2_9HYPO|nr:uncharacterized protein HRG_09055 [Hirsutella rhossiliensis]KAH0960034.1 hypothetical protein HRG_09055 [Hirsutella rhossiliensis]
MDPTTTLITFLLQTDPSVQCVQLIGSWDNFSACYAMNRDVRRGRDQWRGCYSFKDIVCDNEASINGLRRNGGLKMGATYYYYYEVNGSTETYDPAEPWTTACPFLPGQTVNTLTVPIERCLRQRSASLNSLHEESFKTMDPEAKFSTPRPPHDSTSGMTARRLASAPALLPHRLPLRSPPSTPSWKRLFTRRLPVRDPTQSSACGQAAEHSVQFLPTADQTRYFTPHESCGRMRDISPESLRQFLSEDLSAQPPSVASQLSPDLSIPDDVAEEVDDDNFATSAASENQLYATSLSPPPFQRSTSSDTMAQTVTNSSSLTLIAPRPSTKQQETEKRQNSDSSHGPPLPKLETNRQIRWSISATSSMVTSPVSPQLVEDELPSFYDSNDEDEVLSCNDGDHFFHMPSLSLSSTEQSFKGYSLPQHHDGVKTVAESSAATGGLHSPRLLARTDSAERINGANLLGTTIDTGLDDFVSELGWIVDVIGTRQS